MPSQRFPQSEEFNCVFQLIKHQRHKSFHLPSHHFIPLFLAPSCSFSPTFNEINKSGCCSFVLFCLFVLQTSPAAEGSAHGRRTEGLFIQGPLLGPPFAFNSSWDDVEPIVISEASTHIGSGCHCAEITGARFLSQIQSAFSFTGFFFGGGGLASGFPCGTSKTVKLQQVCDLDVKFWLNREQEQTGSSHHLRLRSATPICSTFGSSVVTQNQSTAQTFTQFFSNYFPFICQRKAWGGGCYHRYLFVLQRYVEKPSSYQQTVDGGWRASLL